MNLYYVFPLFFILVACGPSGLRTTETPGANGIDGRNGKDGLNGEDGQDGTDGYSSLIRLVNEDDGGGLSCDDGGITVLSGLDTNRDATLSIDEVLSSADVCHGEAAENPEFDIVELIDPCGDAPGIYDEVLLQLQSGAIIASFSQNSSGLNTRLSVIPNGTYQTTDGSNCIFTVLNGEVSW